MSKQQTFFDNLKELLMDLCHCRWCWLTLWAKLIYWPTLSWYGGWYVNQQLLEYQLSIGWMSVECRSICNCSIHNWIINNNLIISITLATLKYDHWRVTISWKIMRDLYKFEKKVGMCFHHFEDLRLQLSSPVSLSYFTFYTLSFSFRNVMI